MDTRELLARILIAEEGSGHNDPPFFEDYDGETQVMYLHKAEFIIDVLAERGFAITEVPSR